MVKHFEIWKEGFSATGESATAQMIGTGIGNDFDEAVKDYISKNKDHGISENTRRRYMTEHHYQNRRSNWNIWGCNLFDNEKDARGYFG